MPSPQTTTALIAVIAFILSPTAGAGMQSELSVADSPLDLQGPCSFRDVWIDDHITGFVTLVDAAGRSLTLHKKGPALFYLQRNGKELKSTPGSPGEHRLLTIMQWSFANEFDPPLKGTFEEQEHKRYYDQRCLEDLIHDLQSRCAKKKQPRVKAH